jgi:hypothetical protein
MIGNWRVKVSINGLLARMAECVGGVVERSHLNSKIGGVFDRPQQTRTSPTHKLNSGAQSVLKTAFETTNLLKG